MDIEVMLEPTELAPSAARRFVAQELKSLGYLQLIEDAELVVSELVTNCVNHAPGRPLWVDLRRSGKDVVLQVWDCSTDPPVAQDPDFLAEGGRGLHVVNWLGSNFGYDILCCGKVTWVVLG
jgi:anti-sigma regulatory factor (Ser/Thr protein kinase)